MPPTFNSARSQLASNLFPRCCEATFLLVCATLLFGDVACAQSSPSVVTNAEVSAPALAPAPNSLIIGPGDQLSIHVFETPELDQVARVTDRGTVPLILIGEVNVAGLTPGLAAIRIEGLLLSKHYMLNPQVSVTVQEFATQGVAVTGQVRSPGEFRTSTPRTAVDVLAMAGGLTELSDRHIVVHHVSGKTETFFYDNDPIKALAAAPLVSPGDTIIVPKVAVVYVMGDVNRPGGYPFSTLDSKLSMLQAVALAGSTAHSAVPTGTHLIHREPDGGLQSEVINLSAMQKGRIPDRELRPDDIIYVPFSYLRNIALNATSIAAAATSAIIYSTP